MIRTLRIITAVALIAGGADRASAVDADGAGDASAAFSFILIGDTPYASEDTEMLAKALPLVKVGAFPFIIHVGDYKGGRAPCTRVHDDRQAELIALLAPTPVFYTPGDNEWTDCDRNIDSATGKPYSDLARLAMIRERFFSAPVAAPQSFEVERQSTQPENQTWRYRGVRFATVHVVGTANGRDWVTGDAPAAALSAVNDRDARNFEWMTHVIAKAEGEDASAIVIAMQADMTDLRGKQQGLGCSSVSQNEGRCDAFVAYRRALHDAAIKTGKPLLLIHGDTAPFTLDQSFAGEEAPTLWRLNAAGDAGTGVTGFSYGVRDLTLVSVDFNASAPFSAKAFLSGDDADD
jgi:hypothetical protein